MESLCKPLHEMGSPTQPPRRGETGKRALNKIDLWVFTGRNPG
jgi:hypothetical protein